MPVGLSVWFLTLAALNDAQSPKECLRIFLQVPTHQARGIMVFRQLSCSGKREVPTGQPHCIV
jgi:hypothetical protein